MKQVKKVILSNTARGKGIGRRLIPVTTATGTPVGIADVYVLDRRLYADVTFTGDAPAYFYNGLYPCMGGVSEDDGKFFAVRSIILSPLPPEGENEIPTLFSHRPFCKIVQIVESQVMVIIETDSDAGQWLFMAMCSVVNPDGTPGVGSFTIPYETEAQAVGALWEFGETQARKLYGLINEAVKTL